MPAYVALIHKDEDSGRGRLQRAGFTRSGFIERAAKKLMNGAA